MARTGDTMDVDAFTQGSSKSASKGTGKSKDSEVVCWYCEKRRHRVSDCGNKQRDHDKGQSKGSKKATANEEATRKSSNANATSMARQVTCRRIADPKKRARSKQAKRGLADTGCIEVASTDLNALEIGAVQLTEKDHRIRTGIDSGAAVTVFPKTVADDYPMLQTRGHASAESGCAKGASQAQRRVSQVREPEGGGHAQSFNEGIKDERHGTRRVLHQERRASWRMRTTRAVTRNWSSKE